MNMTIEEIKDKLSRPSNKVFYSEIPGHFEKIFAALPDSEKIAVATDMENFLVRTIDPYWNYTDDNSVWLLGFAQTKIKNFCAEYLNSNY